MSRPTRRKAEQSEATRAALLAVARATFAETGYAGATTEEIVRRSGMTRGALYHHYRDKRDLFRAVVEDLQREGAGRMVEILGGEPDTWRRLLRGIHLFLDSCLDPALQRIVLLDAPAVLGWEEWREIDARYGLGMLQGGLALLMEEGVLPKQPVEPLAHLIMGALSEAGLVIARSADVQQARAEVGAAVERLLAGLRTDHGQTPDG